MTKKIIVPADNENGLESTLAQHFGRAPYFTIIELDENEQVVSTKTVVNTGEHMSGRGHPHENLLTLKPDVIVAYNMGPNGLHSFQNAGITVLRAEGDTVKDVMTNFKDGKLKELAGGCEHTLEHHHPH